MALISRRSRQKTLEKMNADVPAGGARVVDVTYGTGQGTLQTRHKVVGVLTLVLFVVGVFVGVFFVSIWPILYLMRERTPPRIVGITASGLVVTSTKFWGGAPSELLGTAELKPLKSTGGRGSVFFGPLVVTLRKHEYSRLIDAVARQRDQIGLPAHQA